MLRATSRLEEAFWETAIGVSAIIIWIVWGRINPGELPMLVHLEPGFVPLKPK